MGRALPRARIDIGVGCRSLADTLDVFWDLVRTVRGYVFMKPIFQGLGRNLRGRKSRSRDPGHPRARALSSHISLSHFKLPSYLEAPGFGNDYYDYRVQTPCPLSLGRAAARRRARFPRVRVM